MTPRGHENGSVLVLALLVTVLILGVGLTVMWVSTSSTKISTNLTHRQEALYAAETGIERARAVVGSPSADWTTLLTGCGATMDDPATKGMVLCDYASGSPAPLQFVRVVTGGTVTDSETNSANVTFTLYVRNDPAEYQWCNGLIEPGEASDDGDCNGDGNNDATDDNIRRFADRDRRMVVRAEGNGKDGLSQVAVEVVLGSGVTPVKAGSYAQKGGSGGQGSNSAANAAIPVP